VKTVTQWRTEEIKGLEKCTLIEKRDLGISGAVRSLRRISSGAFSLTEQRWLYRPGLKMQSVYSSSVSIDI